MTWSFEHSADSDSSAYDLWARYVDVEHYPDWSPGVQWSRLDGPFEVGTTGKTKPPGFPAYGFRLTAVDREAMFSIESRLPGARMLIEHHIEERATGGTRVTHRATVWGPLGPFWGLVLRRSFEKNLTASVERLAAATGA